MLRRTIVDFSQTLQDWDGFGINYVEASQTRDYAADPQEYGGLSTITKADRQQIIELIFGEDGLKPGVVKMFLDPYHQQEPGPGYDWNPNVIDPAVYDHATTTRWMRYFVREGLAATRAWGGDLEILTTLYSPPPWMTVQRSMDRRIWRSGSSAILDDTQQKTLYTVPIRNGATEYELVDQKVPTEPHHLSRHGRTDGQQYQRPIADPRARLAREPLGQVLSLLCPSPGRLHPAGLC